MKLKLISFIPLFFFAILFSNAQDKSLFFQKSDSLHTKRLKQVYFTEAAIASTSLLALNQLWYADYPRSKFHFINDNNEWLQMDKFGHFMSAYYIGKLGISALSWAGASQKKQLLLGATTGFAFLTAVEIFDGYSAEWGASPGDILANAGGAIALIGQELLWKEQRITFKYSFHQTSYAKVRPGTLGENFLQQTLKDYNGQTYWASANIWSFAKDSNFPKWLNVAVGYGAEGMLYGEQNSQNLTHTSPYRQFYAGLDIDLTKIKTKSKLLKTIFNTLNFIKIPAPTLEFTSKGAVKFHFLYF